MTDAERGRSEASGDTSEADEYATLPSEAADDVTVGGWLDVNPSASSEEHSSDVPEPAGKPRLWDRIKRALGAKP